MCANHSLHPGLTRYRLVSLYLIAILLGVFSGLCPIPALQTFGILVSDVFIKIFKCISLPIIALSLIVTLTQYEANAAMKKIWKNTIFYTMSTTIIAAAVTCILYLIISPSNVVFVDSTLQSAAVSNSTNYMAHVVNLIPSNIFSPFLEHQVMGVLLVGVIVGIAIRAIPDTDARITITHFFKGAHGIFLTITGWVVKIIPLGLYGFITTTVIQLKDGQSMHGLGEYLLIVLLANVIQGFLILPIWLKANGIAPYRTMKAMMPALSLAFFSKSSTGTLPVTMKTAERNLGIKPQISRFVLPLCTTINMNGCAAFIFATVIYLMQNNGMEITLGTMVLWIGVSTIAAIGNAGVPMGCFFLSASLLVSMDVPIALLGMILPFYSVIDMVETSLNVWSDTCVAKVIDQQTT
jgi:Na+/H+-dicarboxylate symporter